MGIPSKNNQKKPLKKAIELAKSGKLREATDLLKNALLNPKVLPDSLACARNLGFFLIQNGKEIPFISWVQGPGLPWKDDPFLLFLQGQAYFRLEEFQKAEIAYNNALKNPQTKASWRKQIQKDLMALKESKMQIQKAKAALKRARFLIGGGGIALLLGLGTIRLILRRMERQAQGS